MSIIYLLAGLIAYVILLAYITDIKWKKIASNPYFIFIAAGLAIRLAAFQIHPGYATDINCFKSWSIRLFEEGLSNFYVNADSFNDYPPGYMYVLYLIGMIRAVLGLGYESDSFTFLVKLPAICCDLATGVFLYRLAYAKMKPWQAVALAAAYVFNPAVILDSAVWGQVDSVYTLVILASIYLLTEKKYLLSFLIYAGGVLVKPQALIFAPIYIYSVYAYCREREFSWDSIQYMGKCIGLAALAVLLGILPFAPRLNIMPVVNQYISTIDSYPYATVNAYNFYAFIGANWRPITERFLYVPFYIWGLLFIDVIVLLSLFLMNRTYVKSNYFFIAGLINVLTFMFSVRMHERYLFPSLVFFLAAYLYKRDRRFLLLYAGFSVGFFINCVDILYVLTHDNNVGLVKDSLPFVSAYLLILTGFMVYTAFNAYSPGNEEQELLVSNPPLKPARREDEHFVLESKPKSNKLTKMDAVTMAGLMAVYSMIAFYNLGNLSSPQTFWQSGNGETVIAEFPNEENVYTITFMLGAYHNKEFSVSFSTDGVEYGEERVIHGESVFSWKNVLTDDIGRFVRITTLSDDLMLQELSFRNDQNEVVPIVSYTEGAEALFDEQDLVPDKPSLQNGTYFDEIYHARTAFEYIHSLPVYEWTHPPLGKDLIAAGIILFGMTPFGWRFAGTLFGVLMIPLMYAFGKKMFGDSRWAFFTATLFTFDFMHFAQTRIATIDTFVTFFIIGMYYFMYRYVQMNFYRDKLSTTFIPLGLSGLFMGCAIASKWPGVYAAAGLAVIFFQSLYARYREYQKENLEMKEDAVTADFPRKAVLTVVFCCGAFIVVPLVIYCLSYIPALRAPGQDGIRTIIKNQRDMFGYHAHLESTHPYSSGWWQWPFIMRPIFYYAETVSEKVRAGISSLGNPAVWWCGVVAFFYCQRKISQKFDKNIFFLLVAFASQFLPWVLVSRTTYIYHYFPSVPFVVLMVTYFFKDYVSKINHKFVYAYAAVVVVLFAMFYPVLSGMPVSVWYVRTFLQWMATWQLI